MTESEKNQEINEILKSLKLAPWVLVIGIVLMILAPILFTQEWGCYVLEGSGEIGDAIGGITAPIVNVMGAILVYFALRAQIKANEIIQKQIYRQEAEKQKESISANIGQLYSNFENGVSKFEYYSLKKSEFGEGKYVKGAEAFYKMFQDIYCTNHFSIIELETNPKITEIISLLEICHSIFDRLNNSKIDDKEILWTLTKQQFENIICPRIKRKDEAGVRKWLCSICNENHGLPDELADLIIKIRSLISERNNI